MRQSRFGRVARQGALAPSWEETGILAMPNTQYVSVDRLVAD